jgi:hypothetical protein
MREVRNSDIATEYLCDKYILCDPILANYNFHLRDIELCTPHFLLFLHFEITFSQNIKLKLKFL